VLFPSLKIDVVWYQEKHSSHTLKNLNKILKENYYRRVMIIRHTLITNRYFYELLPPS